MTSRSGVDSSVMEKRPAIARLPGTYGFALFLRDLGLSDAEIATRLGLDEKATVNLLAIAEAKLRELTQSAGPDRPSP